MSEEETVDQGGVPEKKDSKPFIDLREGKSGEWNMQEK